MPTITDIILTAAEAAEKRNDLGAAHALSEVAERVKAEEATLAGMRACVIRRLMHDGSFLAPNRMPDALLAEVPERGPCFNSTVALESLDALCDVLASTSGLASRWVPKAELDAARGQVANLWAFASAVFERWCEDGCAGIGDVSGDVLQDLFERHGISEGRPAPAGSPEAEEYGEGVLLHYLRKRPDAEAFLRERDNRVREECAKMLLDPSGGETWASKIILAAREGEPGKEVKGDE